MQRGTHPIHILILGLAFFTGCQQAHTSASSTTSGQQQPIALAPSKPVATWQTERVTLEEIQSALLERAGDEVLQEYVLDLAIEREVARRQIVLDAEAIIAERELLVDTLAGDPDRAERMLMNIRLQRGLGPTRFARLLRRNALLRALVGKDIVVPDDLVMATWDSRHGPRRVARVIAVEDLSVARDARTRIEGGADFAEVATEISLDASAPRGGILSPVSRHDPAWPQPFRETLFTLGPGEISTPIAVDDRFLVLRMEREEPASGVTLEENREEALAIARLATERLLMDRLARRLVDQSQIEVIDPSIRWRTRP